MIYLLSIFMCFNCNLQVAQTVGERPRGRGRGMESEGGVIVIGRAEIDTRAPFRSVKEAVMLFGERVLAGEVYANKLNEIKFAEALLNSNDGTRARSKATELEETRQNLERTREESQAMVRCVASLKEELEKTKMELELLKSRETDKEVIDSEIEDLKFVENTTDVEIEAPQINERIEFQKKRSVKFASPPALSQVITREEQIRERQFSADKGTIPMMKKKKPLIRLIEAMFPKKKGYQDSA